MSVVSTGALLAPSRMTEGDRATLHVDLRGLEPELAKDRHHLH